MVDDIGALLARAASVRIGSYDDEDIERRARRVRRNRVLFALAGVTVLAAMSVAALVSLDMSGRSTDVPVVTPSPTPPERERFVPSTYQEDGKVVLPMTFLDGTTAELVYPPELDIASLGGRPYGSGTLELPGHEGCCARDFFFEYGDTAWLASLPTVREFAGAEGTTVRLVEAGDVADYLVFRFGRWWLGVWDNNAGTSMTDEQRALWAEHLHGHVGANGFLTLSASGPLRLEDGSGTIGPVLSLEFGEPDRSMLVIQVGGCEGPAVTTDPATGTASLCDPDWGVSVTAYGQAQFIDRVADGLDIRNVRRPTG